MSEHSVERLFDEFATAYLHGEPPDVGAFLERAGDERDDLARMLDAFLQAREHDCLLLAFGAELNYRRSEAACRLLDDHDRAGTGANDGFAGH